MENQYFQNGEPLHKWRIDTSVIVLCTDTEMENKFQKWTRDIPKMENQLHKWRIYIHIVLFL